MPEEPKLEVNNSDDNDNQYKVELFRSLVVIVAIAASATVAIMKPDSASFFSTVAVSATSGYYALSQPRKSSS